MRRIAHLSDVHLLDRHVVSRKGRYRWATKLVSVGRALDPVARASRLSRALACAKASRADHVVISGDLTELGGPEEFEHFAEVLHDAKLPEGAITLVPGNHDRYTTERGWANALAGPLAPFASASAKLAAAGEDAPRVVDRGDVVFLPIDSTCFQSIARSGGVFTRATAEALSRTLAAPSLRDRTLVLVLHHPPFYPTSVPWLRWIDGLRGCAEVLELLARHPRLQILHGHLHRVVDRILAGTATSAAATPARTRVFGAPATCEGPDDASRVRLYDVAEGALTAAA